MFEKFFFLSITAAICTFILGIFGGVIIAHKLHPHLKETPTLNEATELQQNFISEHNQRIICEKTLHQLQH